MKFAKPQNERRYVIGAFFDQLRASPDAVRSDRSKQGCQLVMI